MNEKFHTASRESASFIDDISTAERERERPRVFLNENLLLMSLFVADFEYSNMATFFFLKKIKKDFKIFLQKLFRHVRQWNTGVFFFLPGGGGEWMKQHEWMAVCNWSWDVFGRRCIHGIDTFSRTGDGLWQPNKKKSASRWIVNYTDITNSIFDRFALTGDLLCLHSEAKRGVLRCGFLDATLTQRFHSKNL